MSTTEFTLTILGCGTSTGVPVIGCDCHVCTSDHPRNKRRRCSVHIQAPNRSILVDTGPDLRAQVLDAEITRVHCVLYTHTHADHLHGIDDLRMFSFFNDDGIDAYANQATADWIRHAFPYIFKGAYEGGVPPRLRLHVIDREPVVFRGFPIVPVPILHGNLPILGYRFGSVAYLTDCKYIPEESVPLLRDLDVLIIDGLREEPPHPTHMSIDEAVKAAELLRPRQTYLTHMTHSVDYTDMPDLPDNVAPAYDGLQIRGRVELQSEETKTGT